MKSNKRSSQNRKRNSANNRKNNKKSNSSSKDPDEQLKCEIANEFGIRLNDDVLANNFNK